MNSDDPNQAADGKRDWTPETIEAEVRKTCTPAAIELLQFAKAHSGGGDFTELRRAKFANFGFYLTGCSPTDKGKRLFAWSYSSGYPGVIIYLDNIGTICTPAVSDEFATELKRLFGDGITRKTQWSVPLEDVSREMATFKDLTLRLKHSVSER